MDRWAEKHHGGLTAPGSASPFGADVDQLIAACLNQLLELDSWWLPIAMESPVESVLRVSISTVGNNVHFCAGTRRRASAISAPWSTYGQVEPAASPVT